MNKNEEYLKFWINVKNKHDDIIEDYNNLSDENKCRVDNVKKMLLNAQNISEIIQILNCQLK